MWVADGQLFNLLIGQSIQITAYQFLLNFQNVATQLS